MTALLRLFWKAWWRYGVVFGALYVVARWDVSPPNPVGPSWFPNLILGIFVAFTAIWWITAVAGLIVCRKR